MDHSGSAVGGEIIILTDGEENVPPYIRDVREEVLASKVIVHSVLYTADANPEQNDLSKLAIATGGMALYNDGLNGTSLTEDFEKIFSCTETSDVACSPVSKVEAVCCCSILIHS